MSTVFASLSATAAPPWGRQPQRQRDCAGRQWDLPKLEITVFPVEICFMVCPTCGCFSITEEDDGRRVRSWSGCTLTDFTRIAPGRLMEPTPERPHGPPVEAKI